MDRVLFPSSCGPPRLGTDGEQMGKAQAQPSLEGSVVKRCEGGFLY